MKEINKIVHDERTYIESIGKQDRETVREALADKGVDTILRVCIGVSGQEMPFRALGYFASALAVQERHFPEAELQFVYPLLAAHSVNGVDLTRGGSFAVSLDCAAKDNFPRRYGKDKPGSIRIKSFFDSQLPDDDLQEAVSEILATEPGLAMHFRSSAKTRNSNYVPYVAAHVLMHDTNPTLRPVLAGDTARLASRVISIGAQSERPFYIARMACQRAALLPDHRQVETGQLFTKHVIPPYASCREGEPLLSDAAQLPIEHPVASVQRDLTFLRNALTNELEFSA